MFDDRPRERRRMAAQCLRVAHQTSDLQFRACLLAIAQKWQELACEEEEGQSETFLHIETMIGQELRDQFELPHELPDRMLALLAQLDGGAGNMLR
jgi:hypothetical protein